ncbi:MAG TPA: hypothetical protein VMF61_17325 [Candidatus Acidoferrales bacterium]|nr:hypothetical protein [Candidatus Acidoferrales bacterium]
MKKVLASLIDFVRARAVAPHEVHDDNLRANQFNGPGPAFSPWRALVR